MPLLTIGMSANRIANNTGSTWVDDSHLEDGPTVWLGVFASTLDAESSSGLMNRIVELSYDVKALAASAAVLCLSALGSRSARFCSISSSRWHS